MSPDQLLEFAFREIAFKNQERMVNYSQLYPRLQEKGLSVQDIESLVSKLIARGDVEPVNAIGGSSGFEFTEPVYYRTFPRTIPRPVLQRARELYKHVQNRTAERFQAELGLPHVEAAMLLSAFERGY